jgi:hypothetical protein
LSWKINAANVGKTAQETFVQYPRDASAGWTPACILWHAFAMPSLNLCDDELQDAAQAARVACVQAEKDAEKQSSPKVKGMFENAARRFRELADRFEKARRTRD